VNNTNIVNMVDRDNNIDKFELKTKEVAVMETRGKIVSLLR
jgi:hypothetical protein